MDTRDSLKVVTSNDFITAKGLSKLSLKARKLLCIAIAQCKKTDDSFYYFEVSPAELAKLYNINPNHVYETADSVSTELMQAFIEVKQSVEETKNKRKNAYMKYSLFSLCSYDESMLKFKLNPDMTGFLLNLQKNFTQPLLQDFMQMRSVYTIAIWHLFQREMHSHKPAVNKTMHFDLSLDELRTVTETDEKKTYDILSNFKRRVLDPAIQEIETCQLAKISYKNIKKGRTVVGFHFIAESCAGKFDPSPEIQDIIDKRLRKMDLKKKQKKKELAVEEKIELEELTKELTQKSIFI